MSVHRNGWCKRSGRQFNYCMGGRVVGSVCQKSDGWWEYEYNFSEPKSTKHLHVAKSRVEKMQKAFSKKLWKRTGATQ